jgi:DNA-binding NtrC family response regulator
MENNSTILIVDDDMGTCLTLEALLIQEKYNLLFAHNGVEALSKAKEYTPDLILLDVMMPDIDGYEVCRRIRLDSILAEVPIIMITVLNDRNFRIQGIESGADDFITKPFDQTELLARIRTTVRLNRYRQLLVANNKLERKIDQLSTLYDISNVLNTSTDIDNLMEPIVEKIKALLYAEDVFILLWEEQINRLCSLLDLEKKYMLMEKQTELLIISEIAGLAFQEGLSVLIQDINSDERFDSKIGGNKTHTIKSVLCVPLNGNKSTLGVIGVINKKEDFSVSEQVVGCFSKEDQDLLETMANNISVSIERANFYQKLEKSEILMKRQNIELKRAVDQNFGFENVVGNSHEMINILKKAQQISATDTNILLYGETGTGKEVIARVIHQNSPRSQNNFVPINCSAIPENLLESELFGHEKGSFTGALSRRIGRFEEADGGTLFLDEIGDMPMNLQTKILRVLQDGMVPRLGSNKVVHVDVRVISATHRDLDQLIVEGKFRQDLYYRLKVFVITIPPLRERVGDVSLLVDHFISFYSDKSGKKVLGIDSTALRTLSQYPFPGNVRELQHIIESAIILCKGNMITIDDLPGEIRTLNKEIMLFDEHLTVPKNNDELKTAKANAIYKIERMFLEELLANANGNVSKAAKAGEMNRAWLIELIKKYKIDLNQFKVYQ